MGWRWFIKRSWCAIDQRPVASVFPAVKAVFMTCSRHEGADDNMGGVGVSEIVNDFLVADIAKLFGGHNVI